jgi:hypothetical protein
MDQPDQRKFSAERKKLLDQEMKRYLGHLTERGERIAATVAF